MNADSVSMPWLIRVTGFLMFVQHWITSTNTLHKIWFTRVLSYWVTSVKQKKINFLLIMPQQIYIKQNKLFVFSWRTRAREIRSKINIPNKNLAITGKTHCIARPQVMVRVTIYRGHVILLEHISLRVYAVGVNWNSRASHDEVITCKWFPYYWPFTTGMWGFGVFFVVIQNKLMYSRSSCGWLITPWRLHDVIIALLHHISLKVYMMDVNWFGALCPHYMRHVRTSYCKMTSDCNARIKSFNSNKRLKD